MSGFLELVSVASLTTLLVAESFILREILRETVAFNSRFPRREPESDTNGPILARELPKFGATVLDTGMTINNETILGQSSIFLFSTATAVSEMDRVVFLSSLYTMLGKVDGSLILVLQNSDPVSRKALERFMLKERFAERLQIIADENFEISTAFEINVIPTAVMCDEEGRVSKVGTMEEADDNEVLGESDSAESAVYGIGGS